MRPSRALLSAAALSLPVAFVPAAAQEPVTPQALRSHFSPALGIGFEYPARFEIGTFAVEDLPAELRERGMESPFEGAVVLVEPERLHGYPLDAIEVGEIPVIAVDLIEDQGRLAVYRDLLREEYREEVGGRIIYRLPGFPGPYGDQVFYVLVPRPDGTLIEILAHRYDFRAAPDPATDEYPATEYDAVVDTILGTLDS